MLSVAGKNQMLDNFGGTYLALHTAYPGDSGANETSGGSPAYARKQGTFASATGGSKSLSSPQTFDVFGSVGTPVTLRFVGRWSAATAGTFLGCLPLGGTEKEYAVDTATDVITCNAHGYADTTKIVFTNGSAPAGLTEGTVYFVRDSTTNTFKVAATSGGAAIDLTAQPAAGSVVSLIVEEIVTSQGTLAVNTFTINANG